MNNFLRFLVAVLLLACLALPGCRTAKPTTETETPQHPLSLAELPQAEAGAGLDSLSPAPLPSAGAKPSGILGFLGKVVGTTGRTKYKNVVFNTAAAGATITTTDINKNKAPAATAPQSKATDQREAGTAATVEGDGNQLEQTNTEPAPAPWYSYLLSPVGQVTGVAVAVGIWWLVGWLRRRRESQPPLS